MLAHTFHIPVMGLGFTIDTPIKVAHFGIDSVISIVDDYLIEKMREVYSNKFNLPFSPITTEEEDYRAKRITEYLNLVEKIVEDKFEELKISIETKSVEFQKYIDLLPDYAELKNKLNYLLENNTTLVELKKWWRDSIVKGNIDVNIMTKLDNPKFVKGEQLPTEFNDAHAALRGFANSNLSSSLVLSAGMNPRLYSYMASFADFFPNENGILKKKITLKVSDFRSAQIQGKFLAKKGLWVSEYRVESGLNCGGHAFATDGVLMGPILEEFKQKRDSLKDELYEIYVSALKAKNKFLPSDKLNFKLTAQGGVGTAEEHSFLMDEYNIDSIGWGSPFLLVDEATSIDDDTQAILANAGEEDFYMSDVSPLGVKFNNVKGATKDVERLNLNAQGKYGSSCPKKYLTFNKDFTETPICTASTKFNNIKIEELKNSGASSNNAEKIVGEKACLCVGLSTSALLAHNCSDKMHGEKSLVCPGPNLAYFTEKKSLLEMVQHIYGKRNIIMDSNRPNMFIKEFGLYIEFLKEKINCKSGHTDKDLKYFNTFKSNLSDGFEYYQSLANRMSDKYSSIKENLSSRLQAVKKQLDSIQL